MIEATGQGNDFILYIKALFNKYTVGVPILNLRLR